MGDANRNPNSPQFTGDLPDVVPGGEVQWIVKPSAAFLESVKDMRAAGIDGPVLCPEKDRDVVLVGVAIWTVPQRTTREWPQSRLEMCELARMPLIEFKRRHKMNFESAGMRHCADGIVMPDEKGIDV